MHMHLVFRLIKSNALPGLQDIIGDLLAPVGGQAMQDYAIRGGLGEQGSIDLEAAKGRKAHGGLLFLAHGGPDVGIDDIGAGGEGGGEQESAERNFHGKRMAR